MTFDLAAALKASAPGAVLSVPPGAFGDVSVSGVDRSASPVTIRPLDPANPPVIRSLALNGCAGLVLEALKVRFNPMAGTRTHSAAVLINRCRGVRLVRPDVQGGEAVDGSPADVDVNAARQDNILGYPTARGIQIDASTEVAVQGGSVRTFANGVLLYRSKGVNLLDLDVSDVRFHHICGATVEDVVIERHHLAFARPWKWSGPGDHGDFIHFWTEAGQPPIRGLKIRDGLIDQAGGFPIMGIFLEDRHAATRGDGSFGYPDLEIRGETILGGNSQGILLMTAQGVVADNLLLQTSGDPKAAPSVLLDGKHQVAFSNNRSHDVYGTLLTKRPPPSTYSGDAKVETTPAMIEAARQGWLAQNRASPAAQEPVQPTPPASDLLRTAMLARTSAKIEPLKTKGRLVIEFKMPAQAQAALAALPAPPLSA